MNLIKVKTTIVQALAGLSAPLDDKWINRAIRIFLEFALKIVAQTFNCASFFFYKNQNFINTSEFRIMHVKICYHYVDLELKVAILIYQNDL